MKVVRPVELRNNQRELLDQVFDGEILIVARPAKKDVVVMSVDEFNKREKALRNTEYLAKLDTALKDTLENGGYEFDMKTRKFSETPTKVEL